MARAARRHPPSRPPDLDTAALIEAAERYEEDPARTSRRRARRAVSGRQFPRRRPPEAGHHHAGTPCIAKLASSRDRVDMVRVEAACLALARDAGLVVPDFQVVTFGRHAALLVARFDVQGEPVAITC
jgi:hypothetical protein